MCLSFLLLLFGLLCQRSAFVFSTSVFTSNKIEENDVASVGRLLYPQYGQYLYLNYKEAYGIRYEPSARTDENEQSLPQMAATMESNAANEVTATQLEPSPTINTFEVSVSNDSMDAVDTTTECDPESTTDKIASDSIAQTSNKRPAIAFTALNQRKSSIKLKNNSTQSVQPMSSIRDTLNLIRKRVKQWFTSGIDLNAPLVNGQRFLNVFNIIKFENSECTSTHEMLDEMTGTCYHDYQCTDMGGTSIGECADGLGVCCIFKTECGQKTDQLTTYFQNPSWPDASRDRIICTLTIELQPDVTQILLDFILFELKAPTDGNCVDDQFIVAGQNLNNPLPTLCGINSGQHMYVEVDNAMDRKVFLSILTAAPAVRAYNIRVTQLFGGSGAPSNCLQYYIEPAGWIQTFNYDDTSQFVDDRNPSYFNNLNYAICIKKQWDACTVTYANEVDSVENDFQLINVDAGGTSVIPEKTAGVEIFNCNDDYISVNAIRLCGEKLNDGSRIDDLTLNAPIVDMTGGPIVLPVRTNEAYVGRGFRMSYALNQCESIVMPPDDATTEEIVTEAAPVIRSRIRIRKKI